MRAVRGGMNASGGPGPWFAALLLKTVAADDASGSRQTRLIAHTYPHLALDILNRGQNKWIIMSKVGPFEAWADCAAFVAQWTKHTRGPERHLKRGHELYDRYARSCRLQYWQQQEEGKGSGVAGARVKRGRPVDAAEQQQKSGENKTIGAIKAACIRPKKKYK